MSNLPEGHDNVSGSAAPAGLSDEVLCLLSYILGIDCFNNPEGLRLHLQLTKAAALAASMPRTRRQAVFVSDLPRSREAKLAYGLQQNGWDTILLYREEPTFEAARYFSQTRQYQTSLDALFLALNFSPTVFQVFSCWNYLSAAALIVYKPARIVFDDYDVFAGMVNEESLDENMRIQYALERFCLENADGICCRSLETQYAKRHMGYQYRGKRVFFTDYCWDLAPEPGREKPDKAQLTFANVGNLYINNLVAVEHKDNYHLSAALELAAVGVRSIIYKTFLTDELVQFVAQASGGSPMVSIKHLPYEEMLGEIQQTCHAGLICAPPNITSESNRHFYRQEKRDFAIGNKAFDYIDAEIPVIMDRENRFLFWLINRYQRAFDFEMYQKDKGWYEELLRDYQGNGNAELRQGKRELSVARQAPRLVRFYESL